ncbi:MULTISPECIES: PilZ domain-containing protein [Sphingobium]|uniref:PilZ domain-containing protein n=1 Tax=Sphingobium TaxID=165695 RepID=UPI00159C2EDA|nr:PilZ domain-containing protein [Sphingobium sp. 15-1]
MGDDGREAIRHAITAQVKMRRRMEHSVASSVSDLSLSGFRLRTHMKLAAGCDIALTLPGLEARWAKIVWVRGFEAGCRFHEPLHPAILDDLIRRSMRKA